MRYHAAQKLINRLLATLLSATLLFGCAAPIKRWDPPTKAEVPSYTVDYAITYAHRARKAYQEHIDQQIQLGQGLGSGLIGLAGVIAALAAFGAHSDAIIGAGILGGTAYAIGNWNYSKQRQLIYQAGVEGINCSIRAVTPLYMTDSDLASLTTALSGIDALVPAVQEKIAEAESEMERLKLTGADAQEARRQIESARAVKDSANKATVTGWQLANKVRRVGAELVNAVDRIDAAVGKAVLDTIPDLAAVTKVVSGVAGFANIFTPGAEAAISKGLKSLGSNEGGTVALAAAARTEKLDRLLKELRRLADQLATEVSKVAARIAGYDAAVTTDALAGCGIGEISSGLRAAPDTVTVTGSTDQNRRFLVSGGTKPYRAVPLDSLPDGLTIREPMAFDSTFEVIAKGVKSKGNYSIMVMDASNPYKSVLVSVQVNDTNGNGAGGDTQTAKSPTNITEFAALIAKHTFVMKDSAGKDITLKLLGAQPGKPGQKDIGLTVACEPAPAQPFDGGAFIDALLAQTVKGIKLDDALRALGGKDRLKFLAPDPGCLKVTPGVNEGGSVVIVPAARAGLSKDDIRKAQRNLCLPLWHQTGNWLTQTQHAFVEWRKTSGASTAKTGQPITSDEVKTILDADALTVDKWCGRKPGK